MLMSNKYIEGKPPPNFMFLNKFAEKSFIVSNFAFYCETENIKTDIVSQSYKRKCVLKKDYLCSILIYGVLLRFNFDY